MTVRKKRGLTASHSQPNNPHNTPTPGGCSSIIAQTRQKIKEDKTMLKTNTKKAAENIRVYIVNNFTPEGYTEPPTVGGSTFRRWNA